MDATLCHHPHPTLDRRERTVPAAAALGKLFAILRRVKRVRSAVRWSWWTEARRRNGHEKGTIY
jgi:hypothetical protein